MSMKTIICDRCRKVVGEDFGKFPSYLKIMVVGINNFDKLLGIERRRDLCEDCFNSFWDFNNKNNK